MKSSSSDFSERLPVIPDHEMIRMIGKGSYGEVWLARSVTGSMRAIKVVNRKDFEYDRTFEREFEGIKIFEPISRTHPGLVNVLHVGRNMDDGFYYYVMELADDKVSKSEIVDDKYTPRTLASEIKDRQRVSMDECGEWGATMADALHHIHKSGLTHRDIKPSNVIFVDGIPKIADIGLVALSGQRTFVGTEGFVPPEGPGDPKADIYSFGMVLYEMSSGKDRFDFPAISDPNGNEMERRKWRSLNDIICKACATQARQRYENAYKMSQDLQSLDKGRASSTVVINFSRALLLMALVAIAIFSVSNINFFGPFHIEQIEGPDGVPTNGNDIITGGGDEEGEKKEPEIFENKFGNLRITSVPAGAKVFQVFEDGRKRLFKGIASPDYFEPEVPIGKVSYELELKDYRIKLAQGVVEINETLLLGGHLEFYKPPIEKQEWQNSLGMKFSSFQENHFSEVPFPLMKFEEYIESLPETVDYHKAQLILPNEDPAVVYETALVGPHLAEFFFKWMTLEEKNKGYLAENQYYELRVGVEHEKKDVVYGKDVFEDRAPLFAYVRTATYATLTLSSVPEGASVYINDKYQGQTGLSLSGLTPNPIEVLFRLKGYRDEKRWIDLQSSIDHPVSVKMRESEGVDFAKEWKNSLGIPMLPLRDDVMMSAWEIRVKDFDYFCSMTGEKRESKPKFAQDDKHPVVLVNRNQIDKFCKWLTEYERGKGQIGFNLRYELPTDKDWSFAAGLKIEEGSSPAERDRLVKGIFPWGENWPPEKEAVNIADLSALNWLSESAIVRSYEDGFSHTSPVGSFNPNDKGFYDLAGNVWEWVKDSYGGESNFKEWSVARGGGYDSHLEQHFLSSYRSVQPFGQRGASHGFRIVLVIDTQGENN
ncbi:SUMF1/EgtB/PvdO family nonheme iron enzyme [Verrucomicrobiales bacterium]|nr:SUMF1/EgtB/PvdO family nonheme iron enzyme [Verrucomicrobiales bacterium]